MITLITALLLAITAGILLYTWKIIREVEISLEDIACEDVEEDAW